MKKILGFRNMQEKLEKVFVKYKTELIHSGHKPKIFLLDKIETNKMLNVINQNSYFFSENS